MNREETSKSYQKLTGKKLFTWSSFNFASSFSICELWDFETARWWLQIMATWNGVKQ